MKHVLSLALLPPLLALASCRSTTHQPLPKHSDTAKRIEAVLPPGWELSEKNDEIIISRTEPITSYGCVGLDINLLRHPDLWKKHIEANGVKESFKIRLRLTSLMGFEGYARLKEANNQITVTKGTTIQGREFYEDDVLRSFDPRYRELPRYYSESSSIYLTTTLHPQECLYPDDVAIECERVLQSLESFFTPYSKDEGRRALSIRMSS